VVLKNSYNGIVILIDAEFTCWEGSLASGWSDPAQPAEMIEIGIIAYDAQHQTELASYSSLVKPRVNPVLSSYCLNILPISQDDVDGAPEFEMVMPMIEKWLDENTNPDSPTAGWGKIDRTHTTNQARHRNVSDPFGNRSHIQVDELVKTALGINTKVEREDVRNTLGIEPIIGRHRALADSADLIAFDTALSIRNR
jgi:inhibitor of KinA sporulation pathway (predicted exonuclease)